MYGPKRDPHSALCVKCFKHNKQLVGALPESSAGFIPATEWRGPMYGRYFGLGSAGLGYHFDYVYLAFSVSDDALLLKQMGWAGTTHVISNVLVPWMIPCGLQQLQTAILCKL